MSPHRIAPQPGAARPSRRSVPRPVRPAGPVRPGRRVRVLARWHAARWDRMVEAGAAAAPGTPLAWHAARLTGDAERRRLARILAAGLGRARVRHPSGRAADAAILAAAPHVDELLDRLRDGGPLRPRGVARLRLLLADQCGPMYRPGRGSLTAALRGVLAAL